jgi:hypothetical protein
MPFTNQNLKVSRIKQSGSLREVDDPFLQAHRMAKPRLPLAASSCYFYSAWVNGGGLNIKSTETARIKFNL